MPQCFHRKVFFSLIVGLFEHCKLLSMLFVKRFRSSYLPDAITKTFTRTEIFIVYDRAVKSVDLQRCFCYANKNALFVVAAAFLHRRICANFPYLIHQCVISVQKLGLTAFQISHHTFRLSIICIK